MKKLFLFLLFSAGLFAHVFAQVNVQWQATSGAPVISGSAISGPGNANSAQKLQVCENGAIEFTTQVPSSGYYIVGFASASNPSAILYGLYMYFTGGVGYAAGTGTGPGMPTTSNCTLGGAPVFCDITVSGCPNFTTGDKFKIERVGNEIKFWHVTPTNCSLVYKAGTIMSSPSDPWVVYFSSVSPSPAIASSTVTFSNQCGESGLWTRINSTSIRPLGLNDKIGVGKDPVSTLDVQGTARFSSIANANPFLVITDPNGQLSLSTLKTADIATNTALSSSIASAVAGLPKDWEVTGSNVVTGHGTSGYPSGNAGIGITNPLDKLHVSGFIRSDSLAGTVASPVSGGNKQLFADVNGRILKAPLDWKRKANNDLVAGFPNTGSYASNNIGIGTDSAVWNYKLTIDNRDNTAGPFDFSVTNNDRNAIYANAIHTNCSFGFGILVNTNVLGGTKAFAVNGNGTERALIFGNGMSWFRNRMTIGGVCPLVGLCDENDPMETNVLTIFGSALASGGNWINSDARFKKNITGIEGANELLNKMNPVSYEYKREEFGDRNFPAGMTYGFVAQELKEVLPYTVKKEQDGYYSVNYTAVIPVLVAAMKQQQKQIEELQLQLKEVAANAGSGNPTGSMGKNPATRDGYLDQNVPNPFTGNTEIKYKLPTGGQKGMIGIYDLNGRELKLYQLSSAEGVLSVNGMELQAGTYIYTLIVDGQPYDSKKMILMSSR